MKNISWGMLESPPGFMPHSTKPGSGLSFFARSGQYTGFGTVEKKICPGMIWMMGITHLKG